MGQISTFDSARAPRVSIFIKCISWGFPHRQVNANSYNTLSKVERQASYFFFFPLPFAYLLSQWLNRQGVLVSIL